MSVEVSAMTTPSISSRAGSLTHITPPPTLYGGVGYTIGAHTSRLDDTRITFVGKLKRGKIIYPHAHIPIGMIAAITLHAVC